MKKIALIVTMICFVTPLVMSQTEPMVYDHQCSGYDTVTGRYYTAYWNDTGNGECGVTTDAKFCWWMPWDCSSVTEEGGTANPGNLPCCDDEGEGQIT